TCRGQRQISEIRAPSKMAIVEAPCSGAVERDGADQAMLVEQAIDCIGPFAADCCVGAPFALADLTDIPERYSVGGDEHQPLVIIRRRGCAEEGKDDRPEKVARVRVILLSPQRLLAGKRAEHENTRARVDNRWEAALGQRFREAGCERGV